MERQTGALSICTPVDVKVLAITALLAELELYSLLAMQMAADQTPVKTSELVFPTTTLQSTWTYRMNVPLVYQETTGCPLYRHALMDASNQSRAWPVRLRHSALLSSSCFVQTPH
jgi:hypothetical protein